MHLINHLIYDFFHVHLILQNVVVNHVKLIVYHLQIFLLDFTTFNMQIQTEQDIQKTSELSVFLIYTEKVSNMKVIGFSPGPYLNSSSSLPGRGAFWASIKSFSNCCMCSGSNRISTGLRLTHSTKYKLGSPTNILSNHRNGFSN